MGYKPRERVALEWFIPIIVELLVPTVLQDNAVHCCRNSIAKACINLNTGVNIMLCRFSSCHSNTRYKLFFTYSTNHVYLHRFSRL